ncbi:MAG: DUF5107 domain-containing protein [Fimbriimonadaceae bacterium]|nr:DUF5107 domain-containing protein [Fimbriimonadaceae bacterium]
MRAEVYEDSIDLETELLHPGEPTAAAWPSVPLKRTGRSAIVTLRTVVLENPFIRVVVCPDLGGTVISITDRRTGIDVIPTPAAVPLADGEPRGIRLATGLKWTIGPRPRLGETGSVDFRLIEPDEDGDPVGTFLHEGILGLPASVTACITIPADECSLRLELRLSNQSSRPLDLFSGAEIAFPIANDWRSEDGLILYDAPRDAGLLLSPDSSGLEIEPRGNRAIVAYRGEHQPWLAPGVSETWSLTLTPFGGLGGVATVSRGAAVRLDDSQLAIQVSKQLENGRIWLRLADGQGMDAPAQISPDKPFRAESQGFPSLPEAVVLENSEKETLLSFIPSGPQIEIIPPVVGSASLSALANPPERSEEARFFRSLDSNEPIPSVTTPLLTAVAERERAVREMRSKNWARARICLQNSLQARSDDVLTWWMLGVNERHRGEENDDSLSSAHMIDPMEPRLRAEAFLRTPVSENPEPSPLLRPFAANPDAALEVIESLYFLGLAEDAARFIDEVTRINPIPLATYRLAASYLTSTRMEAEAAQLVHAQSEKPLVQPYPWRPGEIEAVTQLHERFPKCKRLDQLAKLIEAMVTRTPEV